MFLCIKIHVFQKHKFWQNMTQNWFVTWFFMKNAFCKNIKLPLKTSRLAWKNHKKSPAPHAMMWRAKKSCEPFWHNATKFIWGVGVTGIFFMFFSCEAWKVHPHEKHIIFKFYFFFNKKWCFQKSSLQKSAFQKPASGWPQAGRTPAVRRPAPGRPPAVHRAGTGTAADWPGGHFPIVK